MRFVSLMENVAFKFWPSFYFVVSCSLGFCVKSHMSLKSFSLLFLQSQQIPASILATLVSSNEMLKDVCRLLGGIVGWCAVNHCTTCWKLFWRLMHLILLLTGHSILAVLFCHIYKAGQRFLGCYSVFDSLETSVMSALPDFEANCRLI